MSHLHGCDSTSAALQAPVISLQLPSGAIGVPGHTTTSEALETIEVRAERGGALSWRDIVQAVFHHYAARPHVAVSGLAYEQPCPDTSYHVRQAGPCWLLAPG